MPIIASSTLSLASFLIPLAFCSGIAVGYLLRMSGRGLLLRRRSPASSGTGIPRCLYCGAAKLYVVEESVRIEAGEAVGTTCFVCATCGLPQWRIDRPGVAGPATR